MSAVEDEAEETATSTVRLQPLVLRDRLNALNRTLKCRKRAGDSLEADHDFKRSINSKQNTDSEIDLNSDEQDEPSRATRTSEENENMSKSSHFTWKAFQQTKHPQIPVPGWIRQQLEDCGTQTSLEPIVIESDVEGGFNNVSATILEAVDYLHEPGTFGDFELSKTTHDVMQLKVTVAEKEVACNELREKLVLCEARLATQVGLSDAIRNRLVQEFQCSVCQELLVQATVLGGCGHSFCAVCINEWIRRGHNACPNCRQPHKMKVRCSILDAAVEVLIEHASENEKKERSELVSQRHEALERQQVELETEIAALEDVVEIASDAARFLSDSDLWSDSVHEVNTGPLILSRPSETRLRELNDQSSDVADISGPIDRLFHSYITSSSESDSSDTLSSLSSLSTDSSDRPLARQTRRINRNIGRRNYRPEEHESSLDTSSSTTIGPDDSYERETYLGLNLIPRSDASFNHTREYDRDTDT